MDDTQCRTCLGVATDQRLSIDRRVNGVAIAEMVEKLASVKVSSDDMLSKTLCQKCFNDICTGYSFRTKFLDTERILRGFKKKLLSIQGQNIIKQEDPENIESFTSTEECEIIINDESEEQIKAPQHFVMEVGDHDQVITYAEEWEDDDDEIQEYEQIEYLEGDNGNEGNEDFNLKAEEEGSSCGICDENFKTAFGIQHHLYFTHQKGSNPTVCETCNIQYPIENSEEEFVDANIKTHQLRHTEGKMHSCNECFDVFKTLKQLETHKKTVHDFSRFLLPKCKCCETVFPSLSQLNEHLSESKCKDVPEKSFKCYICNKVFNMGIVKKKHVQEAHGDKIGQDCPLCLRCKIPSAIAFENHYKTHFVDPRFSCNFCSRSFYESDRLQMHIRRFHDRTRYFCFFCNKDFRDKSGIARHILGVHFNSRKFKCDVCSKAFTASYNLKEHMFAVHKTASTIYCCDLCSQNFLYRKQYERHREKCEGAPNRRRR